MNAVGRILHGILGVWHGLAAIQNVFEILAARDVAPGLKPLASKNLELVGKLLEPLHPGESTIVMLVAGASAVEVAASVTFVRGAVTGDCADAGFAFSLLLFGAFFLIDDAFDDYDLGARHRAVFTLVASAYAASRAT